MLKAEEERKDDSGKQKNKKEKRKEKRERTKKYSINTRTALPFKREKKDRNKVHQSQ